MAEAVSCAKNSTGDTHVHTFSASVSLLGNCESNKNDQINSRGNTATPRREKEKKMEKMKIECNQVLSKQKEFKTRPHGRLIIINFV